MTATAAAAPLARPDREERGQDRAVSRALVRAGTEVRALVDSAESDSGVDAKPEVEDAVSEGAPVAADTSGSARKRPSRFDSPRWVMLRSAVFPGWGQASNGSWIKASAVAVGEAGLAWRLFDDKRTLDRLAGEVADAQAAGDDELEGLLVDQYNSRLDAYSGRQWLLGAVYVYSLLDAYIDAHFRSFKTEFQVDPALPEGVPPASEMRFGLRFSF